MRWGMRQAGYTANYRRERFSANALTSCSTGNGFSGRRVESVIPVGRVLKTYWQGETYLMTPEQEYIVLGGEYASRTLR